MRMAELVPLVDTASARTFLASVVPEWEWLLAQIEAEGGYVRFPRQLAAIIKNLRIESYPRLYENEAAIGVLVGRALLGPESFEEFDREVTAASPEERGQVVVDFLAQLHALDAPFTLPKTPAEERAAQAAFEALAPDEQKSQARLWQHLLMGFLATFYQHLSLAVHGEKLSALVAQAKAGDTSAFAKAVKIDKRVLTEIPFFKERYERAGLEAESRLLDEVGRRLSAPPYRGRIRHKSLWLTFAALEGFRLLDTFKHEDLLDFCDSIGIGRHKSRIDDVKNLSKRLAEYRRFQGRGLVVESTP